MTGQNGGVRLATVFQPSTLRELVIRASGCLTIFLGLTMEQ
jgi:hypothetical protein